MKTHSSMQIKRRGGGDDGGSGKRTARQKRLNLRRMNPDGEDATVDCKDSLVIDCKDSLVIDCKDSLVNEEGPVEFRPEKRLKGLAGDFDGSRCSYSPPEFLEKSHELPLDEENIIREEKELGRGGSRKMICLSFGSISVMGRRRVMEDALTVSPGILAEEYEFFAAYDGHGGAMAADACRNRLHQLLEEKLNERKRQEEDPTASTSVTPSSGGETKSKRNRMEYWTSIMEASFSKMDEEVQAQMNQAGEAEGVKAGGKEVGSTAVVVMMGTDELVAANCGDSRAVLCRGGVALPLSNDHKPNRPDEKDRVEAAGGRIINWDGLRVQGVLATSRSIGDHYLKPYVLSKPETYVLSKPEITVNRRTEADEFLIIATDGLWDVLSNDTACEVVRRCLNSQINRNLIRESDTPAEAAAVLLAEFAIARGSRDNVSVIVVDLKKASGKISGG